MTDIATRVEIGRQIAAAEADMRRATDRATEIARTMSRAIVLFASPLDIDLDVLNAGIADLRDARAMYSAAAKRRHDLRELLGED